MVDAVGFGDFCRSNNWQHDADRIMKRFYDSDIRGAFRNRNFRRLGIIQFAAFFRGKYSEADYELLCAWEKALDADLWR